MVRQNLLVSAHAARDFPELLVVTGSVHTEVQSWKVAQYIRGPTRLETVSRHLPSHASPHLPSVLLCASVPLCFKKRPSSTHSPAWSTQRHRDNRAGTWSCVVAYRQAFAGDPARHLLRLSARLTLLARGDPASQSAAEATLEAVCSLARRWLPKLGILHPSPNERFDAKHPRYEPNTVTQQARICAGGRPKGRFLPRPQYLPLPDWTV